MDVTAHTLELLAWVARQPRSYSETMEAWRSHCPRLTVWEDALTEGWVEVGEGSVVKLTDLGERVLASVAGPRP